MQITLVLSSGLQLLFYTITLVFILYSLFLAYHWFSYGSSRSLSLLSLTVYLIVSAPLFLTMAILIRFLSV